MTIINKNRNTKIIGIILFTGLVVILIITSCVRSSENDIEDANKQLDYEIQINNEARSDFKNDVKM